MVTSFYLTINAKGAVKANKYRPGANFDEVVMRFTLNLPDSLFKKPSLEAIITIPEKSVTPVMINADTAYNVKEAIQQATGMEVKLTLVNASDIKI